jgi:predicted nucleotidyltransferase
MTDRTVAGLGVGAPYSTYLAGIRDRAERAGIERERQRQATMEQARHAARLLRAQFGALEVVAFGSLVRSDHFDDRSDIDLAVRGVPPERFFQAWAAAAAVVSRSLDLVDLDDCSARLRETIHAEGEPL